MTNIEIKDLDDSQDDGCVGCGKQAHLLIEFEYAGLEITICKNCINKFCRHEPK